MEDQLAWLYEKATLSGTSKLNFEIVAIVSD